jgi:hypothetical protein
MRHFASPTREVGRKFHADGSARRFPGNTIICFVAPDSPIGRAAGAFQAALAQQPCGPKFTFLPPSSFHMTVMELLCDQVRTPERWSADLPLDAPLPVTDAFFAARVPPIPAPTGMVMQVDGLYYRNNIMLTLQAADAATATALHRYREAVAAATGVRFPDHATYGFHISLAYRLYELEPDEEVALDAFIADWLPQLMAAGAAIALPPPGLTAFDDMTLFVPIAERGRLVSRGEG